AQDLTALAGHLDDVPAAVGRIAAPSGETLLLQVVQDGDQHARVDGKRLEQRLLADGPSLLEVDQYLAMTWGEAEARRSHRFADLSIDELPVPREQQTETLPGRRHLVNLHTPMVAGCSNMIGHHQSLTVIKDQVGERRENRRGRDGGLVVRLGGRRRGRRWTVIRLGRP